MDAHIFRLLIPSYCSLLSGMRVEKIFCPFPEVTVFHCYNKGEKFRLALCVNKQSPALFLLSTALPNPARPPATVMRLRKYLGGLRLGQGVGNYSLRSLAFPVLRSPDLPPLWVIFSLRGGVTLRDELPEEFSTPPLWPAPEHYLPLTGNRATPTRNRASENTAPEGNPRETPPLEGKAETPVGAWLAYPLLTPNLRETLAHSDPMEAQALMGDLEYGGDCLFFYSSNASHGPARYFAWPLPGSLAARYRLQPEPLCAGEAEKSSEATPLALPLALRTPALEPFPLLAAASFMEEQALLALYTSRKEKTDSAGESKRLKRLKKTLLTLEREEARLTALVERQADALRIQQALWAVDPSQKTALLHLPGEEGGAGIRLDPRFSIVENMQKIFHHAARGRRGLTMLAGRRKALHEEMAFLDTPPSPETKGPDAAANGQKNALETPLLAKGVYSRATRSETKGPDDAAKEQKNALETPLPLPNTSPHAALIARFISTDGYTLWRGKNAKGNHLLVKTGQPHDYWLHSTDGPSAHVLVRRAHASDEVPQSTLLQAAMLVAERSWQRDDSHASIMVALLRHVKNVKKASPGTVSVDKILQNVSVKIG